MRRRAARHEARFAAPTAPTARPVRGTLVLPRREPAIWALTTGMAAAGVLLAVVVGALEPISADPAPLVLVTLLFLAVEALRVDMEVGPNSHAITMSEVGLVVGALTGRPLDVVIAHLVAVAVVFGVLRRVSFTKLAFNLARGAVVTAIGLLVFRAFAPGPEVSVRGAIAGLVAGLVVGVLDLAALVAVTKIAGHDHDPRELLRELSYAAASSVAAAAIGVQMVFLGRQSPWLVGLAAVPVALMYLAFRSYATQRQAAGRSEFLHHATIALHEAPNLDDGLLALLEHTRVTIRAEFAEIVLLTPEGAVAVRSDADPARTVPMSAAPAELASAANMLVPRLSGAAILQTADPASGALLGALGIHDGIAVRLDRSGRAAGLLLVANRSNNYDEFRRDDMRLVELVANQIGIALEKGWLERSLRQLVELEGQLTFQANHDGLTGVANRRLFNDRLTEEFSRPVRAGVALLLVDLDDFKTVNDTHGHLVGDEMLSIVAHRLGGGVRTGDLVARIGGDEFALVLGGITEPAIALQRASAIVESVRQPVRVHDRLMTMRTSIGIAMIDDTTRSPGDLLRNADTALYRAKALGKDGFVMFDAAMHHEADDRIRLGTDIAAAVRTRSFGVVYQPIHDLVTGEVAAVEALLRWNHPSRGELLPLQFLDLAEESGLVVDVGYQVIDQAVATVARLISSLDPEHPLRVHVNLSAAQLGHPELVAWLRATLVRHSVAADRLVVELTERACLTDLDRTRRAVRGLKHLGVRIALDDFGVGHTALGHVHEMPFDELKLDRTFVRSLGTDERMGALVGSILHFANAMSITAVAEGIETSVQLGELRRRGCRFGQGYLLSMPLDTEALRHRLLTPAARPQWV